MAKVTFPPTLLAAAPVVTVESVPELPMDTLPAIAALEPESAILPPVIEVSPVYVLVPERVNVPAPDLLRVPVPVAIAPETVVLPAPPNTKAVFVPVIEASVKSAPELTVKVGAPVRVTAPKVTPAVPEATLLPLSIVRVCAPIESVPRV